MDKQKKLHVFYSDISALRDRSDQPQLWEFLCCARQQKIKQCKMKMTGFVPLGQVCYWNTVCGSMVTRRQYLWDRLLQQSWSRPDKHGLCSR